MLDVRDLHKEYVTPAGTIPVLSGIDLCLQPGESASIVGPSGAGKSTLLYIVGALEFPTRGTVTLDGQNPFQLQDKAVAEFRNRQIGFVFQDHHLLPQCSVLENVLIPTVVSPYPDSIERARDLLDRVGLANRLSHRPSELSGGEKQRVALARALIQGPRLLLCDEPTGNLDQESTELVASLILDLHRTLRNILVLVTHNLDLASRLGRSYALSGGRLHGR